MKRTRHSEFHVSTAMMTIAALASCSDSTAPQWEYVGVHQARVFQLDVVETIATNDTLSMRLWGDTQPPGRLSLSTIESVRGPMEIGLTVWVEVEKWVGSGTMPPYDPTIQCNYQVMPPFDAGYFRLLIYQPDGSQLADSVLVSG